MGSKTVHRTANTRRAAVEDMSINHRRLDVTMTQEFLYRSNIVTAFEQVRGEGMPEGVARGSLHETSLRNSVFDGFLYQGLAHVMATLFLCLGIDPPVFDPPPILQSPP